MSSPLRFVNLTVVLIAIVVATVALFLVMLTRMLRNVADNLHQLTGDVNSIAGHLTTLTAAPTVTRTLDEIAITLPVVARAANAKAGRREREVRP